jgi:dGTPase
MWSGGPGWERRDRAWREAEEDARLAPPATRSAASRGREVHEDEDEFRTCFERDRDRILHSNAFRRLTHKTQVFLNPDGDHVVTRMTHSLQVAQVARSIAVTLGLNEVLCEAMALGHDIGHSVFGHTGEEALSPFVEGEWQHAIHGVRLITVLEPLNLTWEVRDGIRQSSWKNDPPPSTPEGMVIRFADRIAYLAHDAVDAQRAGVLSSADFPIESIGVFGQPGREWIDSMIRAVVEHSAATGSVSMDPATLEVMHRLRDFMFQRVYLRPEAQEQARRAIRIISDLVEHYIANADQLPVEMIAVNGGDVTAAAVDHVAGMTDRYALRDHDRLFRPTGGV